MKQKKLTLVFALLCTALSLSAVPARRGVYKTLTLGDGSQVKATLSGDENMHFYIGEDGVKYVSNSTNGTYDAADMDALRQRARVRIAKRNDARKTRIQKRSQRKAAAFTGSKKGLIVLVQFKNKSFATGHTQSLYNRIANEEGFTSSDGFIGSVRDYFKSQSYGLFDLSFDVVGPVTLSQNYSYYGGNDNNGNDKLPDEMVREACKAIDSQVNFADYDWDGDGEVDQVFVLYAGEGEASGGDENTIWPHEWELASSTGGSIKLDATTINTYGCSNELVDGSIDGIGTICHEFSHCMGLPDLYDTAYTGNYGMGSWGLMDYGSYNGDGFVPAGYTSYERWQCGWLTPEELTEETSVSALPALVDESKAYVLYNSGNKNEFYMFENRQQTGWDAELPASGLLVLHIDYDENVWAYNEPNTTDDTYSGNTHQRFTIFHADNDDDSSYYSTYYGQYTKTTEEGDPYPYNGNNSLTASSTPAATLYNKNASGTYYMELGVKDITQNADGTVAFTVEESTSGGDVTPADGVLFHETFDQCNGTGGNDGKWSGNIASSAFTPDVNGWTSSRKYGANKCARFNAGSNSDELVSPSFTIDGDVTIKIKMAPWSSESPSVNIYIGSTLLGVPTLKSKQWNEVTYHYSGTGTTYLRFVESKRFFVDDVLVTSDAATAIKTITDTTGKRLDGRIFTLSGQYVGNDINAVDKGIYIVNGKKIVKK